MNPIQILAVIKQGNSASFPNQEARRVFTKLQKNHTVRMDQVNQAASLADQYVQGLVSRGKIPAPPVDEAVNIASSQIVGKVPVDQAELTATGQGSVQQKQRLQNAGISSGGSLQNNVSSSNLSINASNVQQSLYDEREEIADLVGELTSEGAIKVPIRDREGNIKRVRTLKSTTPTLIERELSRRTGTQSSDYGRPDLTALKHNMDLGSTYDTKFFNQAPSSVTIGGETFPVNPVSKPVVTKTPYTQTEYVDDQVITSLKVPYVSKGTAIDLQNRVNNQLQYRGNLKVQIQNEFLAELRPFQAMQKELIQKADMNKKKVELLNKRIDINPAQKQRISGQLAQEYQTLKNQYAYTNQEVSRITNRRDSRFEGITETTKNIIAEQRLPLTTAPGISKGNRFYAELDDAPKGKKVTRSGGEDLLADMADDLIDDADALDIRGATPDPIAYKTETVELRPERPMIDMDKKTGGGRNIAYYTGGGSVDERVRSISTGGLLQETPQRVRQTQGRYRDYDPGTDELNQGGGAPQGPYRSDSELTGNVIDKYGTRARKMELKDLGKRDTRGKVVLEETGRDLLKDDPKERPTRVTASKTPLVQEATPAGKKSFALSSKEREIRTDQSKSPQRRATDAQSFVRDQIKQMTGAVAVGPSTPLAQKPSGTYVPPEGQSRAIASPLPEKQVKKGKMTHSALGDFLAKNYYIG
jgi:hypothetical protein